MALDPAPPMSLDLPASWAAADPVVALSTAPRAALRALGPVLLIGIRAPACQSWRRECVIDSFGVRESLWLGDCRLFRLPDSDFYGWERLADEARLHPRSLRCRGVSLRVDARVVRASPAGWSAVRQLSALGWEQARQIAQLEGAAWREARRGG